MDGVGKTAKGWTGRGGGVRGRVRCGADPKEGFERS